MLWNTQKHTPTFLLLVYLFIFSFHLSFFPSLSLALSLMLLPQGDTQQQMDQTQTHTFARTYAHTHAHRELQASQLSACCCLSEAEHWSLFQSDGSSASFAAVWKNLALIFKKMRKMFLGCSDFSLSSCYPAEPFHNSLKELYFETQWSSQCVQRYQIKTEF